VPPDETSTNQPIGRWDREYGTKPSVVSSAGKAVIRGMHVSGVETAVKHFPGLGRASGNTDTTFGVTDTVTTRHDAYITPYAAGTRTADAGVVMVSLATYTQIDARHRAVFSPTILHGMLRDDLGFTGVVMSDSMDAVAVSDLTPAQRAVRFVDAGGDLVLTSRMNLIHRR
jgi:beta-N-acetylhexosaminidase